MKISSEIKSRTALLGLLFLAATSLGGCITDDIAMDDMRPSPAYAGSEAYPITVAKGPQSLEISSKHGTLEPTQINAVQGFVNQAALAGVTPMTIRRPSGGGASARVASEIASLLAQQGIDRNRIRFATYSASSRAPVIISYVSTYAKTKPCGEWPDDLGDTATNQHFASHGCAVQANIAAMVADPSTLIIPTPVDPVRAPSRVNAIKSLENPSTTRNSLFSIF
jgi:pilus assembly protein CpaD